MESPARLGVNIGPNTYYNDQQMVVNPLAHGAFNCGQQVGFLRVGQVRGDTFQDERFRSGDASTAYRTPSRGMGYVIATGTHAGLSGGITNYDPVSGFFTKAEEGPRIATGDYLWLRGSMVTQANPNPMPGERELGVGDFRVEVSENSEARIVVGHGKFPGLQARLQVTEKSGYAALKHYFIALPSSRYRVHVQAKAETGSGTIGARLTNIGIPSGQPGNRIFMQAEDSELTSDWKKFEFTGETFDDQRIRDTFSALDVRVSGGPVTAQIESIELIDESNDSDLAFSKRVIDTLREAKCGVLRFYGIASPGSLVHDITAAKAADSRWTFTDGPGGFQRHSTHAVLDDWLKLSEEVGAAPWINIGGANTPEDWHNLISYLAAPKDFGAAYRRNRNGREHAWTDSFDTIYLELGNEWWNGIFQPFVIERPEDYGALCNTIFEHVRAHPHFDADKIKLVIGGWAVNAHNWNVRLDRASKHHDIISVAPYLAHALDTPDYAALFADVEGSFENGGRATIDGLNDTRLAIYELNTHTTGGAASASDISGMATSLGAGIAVLDQAMSGMYKWGATPINYFTYFQRSYGRGDNERQGLWGNLVLARDGSHRPRPVWQGLRLANRHVIDGDMVVVQMHDSPTWNQVKNGSVPALKKLPYLKAYAFVRDNQSANVLLINRHLTSSLRVRVQLPFTPKSEVTHVQLSGSTLGNHNEDYERVQLSESEVSWADTGGEVELAPHSATALQFTAE
jgi:alpha-L-arabinofuranosidase